MDREAVLDLLLQAARLKWLPRSGWVMRGIADPESVAEHSWGVALLALTLGSLEEGPVDREKLLVTALLHDLPEVLLSDIPTPALRYLAAEAKQRAEEAALADLLAALPERERWRAWWDEFESGSSVEGRLVRDADRLDMMIQAYLYEERRGAALGEFWVGQEERPFHSATATALFTALSARRRTGEPVVGCAQ